MGGGGGWRVPQWEPPPEKKKEKKRKEEKPTEDEEKLAAIYQDMRVATARLEQLIESSTLSAKDLHRLDKSVVVQKVGYKMIKKILKKKGFKELKRLAFQDIYEKANLPS